MAWHTFLIGCACAVLYRDRNGNLNILCIQMHSACRCMLLYIYIIYRVGRVAMTVSFDSKKSPSIQIHQRNIDEMVRKLCASARRTLAQVALIHCFWFDALIYSTPKSVDCWLPFDRTQSTNRTWVAFAQKHSARTIFALGWMTFIYQLWFATMCCLSIIFLARALLRAM